MIRWIELLPLLGVLLAGVQPDAPLTLRWDLANKADKHNAALGFYEQVDPASGGRRFRLDQDRASKAGVDRCVTEMERGVKSDFCKALAERLAPVLSFAFETTDPALQILQKIEVKCTRASLQRSSRLGFVTDEAAYELGLPVEPGTVVERVPSSKLTFTQTGTLALRAWPKFSKRFPGGVIEIVVRLHLSSASGTTVLETGKIVLEF